MHYNPNRIITLVDRFIRLFSAAVWLVNGLFCKVLGLVPRHEMIVSRILGPTYAHELTVLIGLGEIGMAVWVLSALYRRVCSALQIMLVMTMNILEFWLVPDLLLHGRFNLLWAAHFCLVIYFGSFYFYRGKSLAQPPIV